jgi:hypothetical protein
MKLYIANCTKQIHHFFYRVIGSTSLRMQPIKDGGQIQISGDLQPEEANYIIGQHEIYGMIKADEVDRTKPFAGLCYSVDKPVAVAKIQKLFIHNQEVLEHRAEDTLRATALASSDVLESKVTEAARDANRPLPALGDLEMSIVEETRKGPPSKTAFWREGNKGSGGIRVSRNRAA